MINADTLVERSWPLVEPMIGRTLSVRGRYKYVGRDDGCCNRGLSGNIASRCRYILHDRYYQPSAEVEPDVIEPCSLGNAQIGLLRKWSLVVSMLPTTTLDAGLCSTQIFRVDSTLTHMTILVSQLRLNSNYKFANLTQLRLNSNPQFASLTQHRLNSFESQLSQI